MDKAERINTLLAEIEEAENLRRELLRADAASSTSAAVMDTCNAAGAPLEPRAREETKHSKIERLLREAEQVEAENIRLKSIAGSLTATANDSGEVVFDEKAKLELARKSDPLPTRLLPQYPLFFIFLSHKFRLICRHRSSYS